LPHVQQPSNNPKYVTRRFINIQTLKTEATSFVRRPNYHDSSNWRQFRAIELHSATSDDHWREPTAAAAAAAADLLSARHDEPML